jgi:hypothetical protein
VPEIKRSVVGTEFRDFVRNRGWNGASFKGVAHSTEWIFKDVGGKTEFTHGLSYVLPIFMGGSLVGNLLFRSAWIKVIEQSLQNLKEILES